MTANHQVAEASVKYLAEAARQIVPVGYKQTEVGVIPWDWEPVSLHSMVLALEAGVSVNSVDKPNAFPHGKHILKTSCVENGYFYADECKSILTSDLNRAKATPIEGSIIVSRMNTPELVGELGYVEQDCPNAYLPDRLWQMKFRKDIALNTRWLAYILSFPVIARKIKDAATGTSNSMKNISKGSLLSLTVPTPKFEEQTAIANALSDVDALINELEKLIAKKQAIKTATMQQLLTGRTRLPQFALREDGTQKGYKQSELGEIPEDWEVVFIDECVKKVGSGKTPSGGSTVYVDSGRPFIRSQNVDWGILDLSDVAYITEEIHRTFMGTELCEDDVLLNITGASIGRCSKSDMRVVGGNVNQHVCIIRPEPIKLNPALLVELINSRIGQDQIDSYQAGGNREGLNFSQVRNLRFAVADNIQEQSTIATILSDMDADIQTLQQRLSKTRQIKQGMMQELLTGRIRLVS